MELLIRIVCSSCKNNNAVLLDISETVHFCEHCGRDLFELQVLAGYVYLLTNSSMPGLIKVGYTERDIQDRVDELNSTGLPLPFEIEAYWSCSNPYEDEQTIHANLASYRLATNREFFLLDVKTAIQAIIECIGMKPAFLKTPELLMTDEERQKYEDMRKMELQKEVERLRKLYNHYWKMYTELESNDQRNAKNNTLKDMLWGKRFADKKQEQLYIHMIDRGLMLGYLREKRIINSIDEKELNGTFHQLLKLEMQLHGINSSEWWRVASE